MSYFLLAYIDPLFSSLCLPCLHGTAKGLNPDDFIEEEEELVEDVAPTLEDKLADASLKEIDEIEVSENEMKLKACVYLRAKGSPYCT